MHKVLKFDLEKNGYEKEYDVNPVFYFTLALQAKQILSDSVYINIVGEKSCKLNIVAEMTSKLKVNEFQG